MARHIGGRRHRDLPKHSNAACHQIALFGLTDAQNAIDAFPHQIDITVPFTHEEFDIRIGFKETRQGRHDDTTRLRALHFDPQQAARLCFPKSALGLIEIRQDGETTLVIGLSIERGPHLSRRALQQSHLKAGLQLLDGIGDGGGRQPEILGGANKAASFHNAREHPQSIEPVHYSYFPNSVAEICQII